MSRIRTVALAAIALLIAGGQLVSAGPAAVSTLTGIARDLLGRPLAGVEIFVQTDGGGTAAGATRTDAKGRFSIGELPPRLYRVAGFKDGYLASMGRVNTALVSTLELLFRPLPRLAEQPPGSIPADRAWALRLPARSILRDEQGGDELRVRDPGKSAATIPGFLATLDGRLDQSFGFGALGGASAVRDSGMQGSETRLQLSSPLGERGTLDLRGGRERVDGGNSGATRFAAKSASDLLVSATFDATDDSRVSVQSFFAGRDRASSATPVDAAHGGADRSWGWDARWSTQLDPSTHVDVGVDYRDASFALPAGALTSAADRRALQASGNFESIAAPSHRVQLAFAAGRAAPPDAIIAGGLHAPDRRTAGAPGWSVRLNAQDTFSLTGRTSLVYGLGCLGPLDERSGSPVVVSRFGGIVSRERVTARLVLSYLADAAGSTGPRPPPMGYDAEVQLPLPGGLLVRGSASYAPALPAPALAKDEVSRRPIYVTDGNAAVHEASFGIERATAFGSAFARYSVGSADGALAVFPAAHAPVQLLDDQSISFRSGRGGFRLARSGTQIEASWRSVSDADALPEERGLVRRSLETSVVQDLPHAHESGIAWKLLLLYRSDRTSSADPATIADLIEEPDFGREIRAGVALTF